MNVATRIQLQLFTTNRIKMGLLEPARRYSDKGARCHNAGPVTSDDVIGLPPVTISLATLYNCFLSVEDYTKDTQEIS